MLRIVTSKKSPASIVSCYGTLGTIRMRHILFYWMMANYLV